jgi:tRNA G37 N-methylase TrmD
VAPHVTSAAHFVLTGGDVVALMAVAAVVAIVVIGQVVRKVL